MANLEDITNWLKGIRGQPPSYSTDPSSYIPASQNPPFPTSDDVNFARKNDYSYGQFWSPEFEGKSARVLTNPYQTDPAKPLDAERFGGQKYEKFLGNVSKGHPDLKDTYAKAALAAQRSPLATLGFQPDWSALDLFVNPKQVQLSGSYAPDIDQTYFVNEPSTIVHESMHRGINALKHSPYWKPEFDAFGPGKNEILVRYLMQTKMGNPEDAVPQATKDSINAFYNDPRYRDKNIKLTNDMEDAAAQYIAAKHPGGPR